LATAVLDNGLTDGGEVVSLTYCSNNYMRGYIYFYNTHMKNIKFNYVIKRGAGLSHSVGITTRLRAGRPRVRGSIPGRGKRIFSLHNIQTASGAHPAPHTMGTGECIPGGKAAVA
jgi:hypothetical protein